MQEKQVEAAIKLVNKSLWMDGRTKTVGEEPKAREKNR